MQVDLQKSEVWPQLLMLRDAADTNLASCFREVFLYQGSLRAFADSYPPILSGILHCTATSSESRHLLGLFPPADTSHETTPLTCWYSSSGICSYNRRRFSKISNLLAVCIRTLSDWNRLQSHLEDISCVSHHYQVLRHLSICLWSSTEFGEDAGVNNCKSRE